MLQSDDVSLSVVKALSKLFEIYITNEGENDSGKNIQLLSDYLRCV